MVESIRESKSLIEKCLRLGRGRRDLSMQGAEAVEQQRTPRQRMDGPTRRGRRVWLGSCFRLSGRVVVCFQRPCRPLLPSAGDEYNGNQKRNSHGGLPFLAGEKLAKGRAPEKAAVCGFVLVSSERRWNRTAGRSDRCFATTGIRGVDGMCFNRRDGQASPDVLAKSG